MHALFSFPSTIASAIALLRGVPLVIRPLGTLNEYGVAASTTAQAYFSGTGRTADSAAGGGGALRWWMSKRIVKVEITARTTVIPLAVEYPAEMNEEQAVSAWPQYAGKKLVLFLSRLHPKKNVEALLDAWAELKPDAQTLLVIAGGGDGVYVKTLVERASALGIDDGVSWAGYVEGRRKMHCSDWRPYSCFLHFRRTLVLPWPRRFPAACRALLRLA